MWWPHTAELAHSHNHANRNVEAAMSDSDKTFDFVSVFEQLDDISSA